MESLTARAIIRWWYWNTALCLLWVLSIVLNLPFSLLHLSLLLCHILPSLHQLWHLCLYFTYSSISTHWPVQLKAPIFIFFFKQNKQKKHFLLNQFFIKKKKNIYIYMCVCVCVCVCMYEYIYRNYCQTLSKPAKLTSWIIHKAIKGVLQTCCVKPVEVPFKMSTNRDANYKSLHTLNKHFLNQCTPINLLIIDNYFFCSLIWYNSDELAVAFFCFMHIKMHKS